jgi:hypothetical protein
MLILTKVALLISYKLIVMQLHLILQLRYHRLIDFTEVLEILNLQLVKERFNKALEHIKHQFF